MTTPVGTDGSEYRGLQIVNVVASGQLGVGEIDTDVLGSELDGDQTVLPGRVYLKAHDEAPVAMVFRSGVYSIAGASSWQAVLDTLEWLSAKLDEVGLDVNSEVLFGSADVKYLVVTGDLGSQLNLSAAVIGLGMEHSEYEPEQFPAVIYRPDIADCTVLLFSTGKVTITGARDIQTAYRVYEYVESSLQELIV